MFANMFGVTQPLRVRCSVGRVIFLHVYQRLTSVSIPLSLRTGRVSLGHSAGHPAQLATLCTAEARDTLLCYSYYTEGLSIDSQRKEAGWTYLESVRSGHGHVSEKGKSHPAEAPLDSRRVA